MERDSTKLISADTPKTSGIVIEGAWGGASWDGVLNVGMAKWAGVVNHGVDRFSYEIEEYNDKWVIIAEEEINKIKRAFCASGMLIDIQHIGSTSFPGAAAKPFIDIILGIRSMIDAPEVIKILFDIGYEKKFATNEKWIYLIKLDTKDVYPAQQINICVTTHHSDFWKLKVAFRDYMRLHPEDVEEYSRLKLSLKQSGCDFYHYTKGKETFIIDIIVKIGFSIDYYMKTFSHIRK